MRILHVLRAPVGGLFRHVIDLSGEQALLGHDVGLIVATSSDALTEKRLQLAASHLSLGIARVDMARSVGLSDAAACRWVRRYARKLECDVLHGHGAKGGAYARIAGIGLENGGVPIRVFYTPHGGTLNYAPNTVAGRVYHRLERWLDPLTDGIIFESAHAARVYEAVVGPGRAPRRVIYNGLRPSDFVSHQPAEGAPDVLFVGELRRLKGVDVLLNAIARIKGNRGKALRAVIVGDGPDRDEFLQLAEGLGLGRVVAFPGAMPAADAFALGSVIVVPSRKESMPYIVLEAAAAGMPLVATGVGGIPEIVEGTDMSLVPPDDVDALADAISNAIGHPMQARARADRLKSSVSERFTVARMADDVMRFYTDRCASSVHGAPNAPPILEDAAT